MEVLGGEHLGAAGHIDQGEHLWDNSITKLTHVLHLLTLPLRNVLLSYGHN